MVCFNLRIVHRASRSRSSILSLDDHLDVVIIVITFCDAPEKRTGVQRCIKLYLEIKVKQKVVRKSYRFSKLNYFSKFHLCFTPMNSFPSPIHVLNHAPLLFPTYHTSSPRKFFITEGGLQLHCIRFLGQTGLFRTPLPHASQLPT